MPEMFYLIKALIRSYVLICHDNKICMKNFPIPEKKD